MKRLKYDFCIKINHGTAENPKWEETITHKTMDWNEANEAIAKTEAMGGEYTIEDDGVEEVAQPTTDERLEKLEKAIEDIPTQIKNALKAFLNNT